MRKIVENYSALSDLNVNEYLPMGSSSAPKELIFHILEENASQVDILDIGFGTGGLGRLIKAVPELRHWNVDGIDGWEANCINLELINKKIYRNIWHGFAQELPSEVISAYKIICLLDVIEHLTTETAKWLFRTLLTNMGNESFLFISTPLWFYPQDHLQNEDLEEHLIGVPATSMFALLPKSYAINNPLVGGFVYGKSSLDYIDFFQPTSNKKFTFEMGMNILNCINMPAKPGVIYKTNL